MARKTKIAIVNRSFWPKSPAIGEALLLLSESLADDYNVVVLTQTDKDFSKKLAVASRGKGVNFFTFPALTSSSSNIVSRLAELLLFSGFTLVGLCIQQPDKVYVSTNPPIFSPLAVRWYCQLFNKKYIYHLQDIHPEITSIVTGKKNLVTRLIKIIDTKNIAKASSIITLTEQMKDYLIERAGKELSIHLLNNPSVQNVNLPIDEQLKRQKGFVYCGNAGRLQRIPLLLQAVEKYITEGGGLPFVFAGGGIYSKSIMELAKRLDNVTYLGVLPADQASNLMHQYSYGLMPIEDEVTQYAFPSKSSSYLFSGCHIIAICGQKTSVATWVLENEIGYVAEPNIDSLVSLFHTLEKQPLSELTIDPNMLDSLTPQHHAKHLKNMIVNM
ncbi:glycosyltransferase family protein [Psychrobacter sanguinis]|uniref:glycosyltransferase n=1 Tax=Psychrobacter sanguinis TaxID=861445 RepID=UPI001917A4CC|nr:glycosyltransferase [Psychrobacter sanguinis]MCC3345959.1 glycosyltransferase [Psychrobacter sanguinis]